MVLIVGDIKFLVDGWTMIEFERLPFKRRNQNVLRAGKYVNLQGATSMSDSPSHIACRRIIIPSIYPGSLRFITEIYRDVIGICMTYKFPDLFITFTCNSKWSELSRFFSSINLRQEDQPDILSRLSSV